MIKLEVGKKYKTKDNKDVIIFAQVPYVQHSNSYYFVGKVDDNYIAEFDKPGFSRQEGTENIVSEYTEPKKLSGWINVYRNGISNSYDSFERASADWKIFSNECIACIDLSVYNEGHGL